MRDFEHLVIGNATLAEFCAALLYAYITAFAMLMYRAANRNPASKRTPRRFSFDFFMGDNAKRIYANIVFIFLGVRFSQLIIGAENTAYAGLLIGLMGDGLAKIFENIIPKQKADPAPRQKADPEPSPSPKRPPVKRKK